MNKLIIEGVDLYNGVYEFEDFANFTNRELHRIKKMTGIRVGEFQEALEAGDNDLLVALATIILERAGKSVIDDVLWDADAGLIRLEFETEQAEDPTQVSPTPPENGSVSETSGESPSSGMSSRKSSDLPESDQSRIGDPLSETPTLVRDFSRSPSAS